VAVVVVVLLLSLLLGNERGWCCCDCWCLRLCLVMCCAGGVQCAASDCHNPTHTYAEQTISFC
jgi:hypothetical protein